MRSHQVMNFSTFFSEQARRPRGLFGRIVMGLVFDRGNAFLNDFAGELLSIQEEDHVLEIGFGTGKLMHKLVKQIDKGLVEGIEFSKTMASRARRRNKKNIVEGRVKIIQGDFDSMPYEKERFSKVYSVNTIYFWPAPLQTAKKAADILKPGGKLVLAFEDIEQLKQRNLNRDIFRLYSTDDIQDLLAKAGFSGGIKIVSRRRGELIFHCVVARK